MRRLIMVGLLSYLVVSLSGCGYTTRSMIASEYRTIYIEPFVNKTDITTESYGGNKYRIYRPLLETDITRNVTNKYLFDGNLKPAPKESADVILKGELIDFRKDPLRYTDADDVLEYRVNLVVNISLWNRKTQEKIWEENGFTGLTSYFTSGANSKSEAQAINDALDDLARRVVERTVEQW